MFLPQQSWCHSYPSACTSPGLPSVMHSSVVPGNSGSLHKKLWALATLLRTPFQTNHVNPRFINHGLWKLEVLLQESFHLIIQGWHVFLPIHLPGFVHKWGIHAIPTQWFYCPWKFSFFHHHQRMCGSHHDRLTTQPDLARTVFTDQTKRDLNQVVSLGCTLETIITHRIHVCYIW